jgi:hypothetical protein
VHAGTGRHVHKWKRGPQDEPKEVDLPCYIALEARRGPLPQAGVEDRARHVDELVR